MSLLLIFNEIKTATFRPLKLFHFHIKWILDLSTGKEVVFNTKIVETWNVGKLVEKVIKNLTSEEFNRDEVKAEILEDSEPLTGKGF